MKFLLFMLSFVLTPYFGQVKSYPEIDRALEYDNFKFPKDGKYKEGIAFNLKLIQISRQKNYKKGVGWGYHNIGNLYCTLNQYEKSLQYLELAEKELEGTSDDNLKAKVQTELGKVNHFLGLYDIANRHYNKALSILRNDDNAEKKLVLLSYILACKASNFEELKKPDSMYSNFKKAYSIYPEPITAVNISSYFMAYRKRDSDSAKFYLESANNQLKTGKFPKFQKLVFFRGYGKFHFQKKQYELALEYQHKAFSMAKEIKKIDEKLFTMLDLANTYRVLHNYNNYNKYLNQYTLLNDSLDATNKQALNHSVDKLVIDTLNSAEANKQQMQKRNQLVLFFLISGIIVFGLLSFYFYTKKKNEKNVIINSQQNVIAENILEKRKLEHKINIAFDEVVQLAKKNDPTFLARFKEVYPEFCENILALYPDILNSEFTFCAYLKLNFSTKEIASYTYVTEKAVQSRKSRIRKKLSIASDEDLYIWMNKL